MEVLGEVVMAVCVVWGVIAWLGRPRDSYGRPTTTLSGRTYCPYCGTLRRRGYTVCRRCGH